MSQTQYYNSHPEGPALNQKYQSHGVAMQNQLDQNNNYVTKPRPHSSISQNHKPHAAPQKHPAPEADPANQVNEKQRQKQREKRAKQEKQKANINSIEEHILEKYHFLQRVGKGAYGVVWKAEEKKPGRRKVAIKKIFDAFRNEVDSQRTYWWVKTVDLLKFFSAKTLC